MNSAYNDVMTSDSGSKKGLGRGLAALLGENPADDLAELDKVRAARTVPVEQVRPNPLQPRQTFAPDTMQTLIDSVRERGILQPILVRRTEDPETPYEIIAGERRWRAAQQAQLHDVPVIVKDLDDADALEVALVENIQRQDLNPIEEANGFQRLTAEFGYTQDQLAQVVGRSRSLVANTMRLLNLPEPVQAMLADGQLSAGAARPLITARDPLKLAREIVERGLNARQAEALAQPSAKPNKRRQATAKDADTIALQDSLETALGLKVDIRHRGKAGGMMQIAYSTLEQLDDVCRRLSRQIEPIERDFGSDDFDGDDVAINPVPYRTPAD